MANENKNKISKIGYYTVVAFSIAIIGSVSWFTVSRLKTINSIGKTDSGKNNSSYTTDDKSYNKNKTEEKEKTENKTDNTSSVAEDVAKATENEPYSLPEADKQNFTMPVTGAIIKPFSNTSLQYSKTYSDMRIHEGIDIKCDEGTSVKSAANGTVTDIYDDEMLGKTVTVDHGNGISVKYCGFKAVAVTKGTAVKSGDILGTSGTVPCECKDEPHIHLEAADETGLVSLLEKFAVPQ